MWVLCINLIAFFVLFSFPLARASTDAPWFDCISVVESEQDDDFYSVRDGM